MTWGVRVRGWEVGGRRQSMERRWRGCCSLHHRQDKWRTDRWHSTSLPYPVSFQLRQHGSGSASVLVSRNKWYSVPTAEWSLPQQELRHDHSYKKNKNKNPYYHHKEQMDSGLSQRLGVFLQRPHGGGVTQKGMVERTKGQGGVKDLTHSSASKPHQSCLNWNPFIISPPQFLILYETSRVRHRLETQRENAVAEAGPWTESKLDSYQPQTYPWGIILGNKIYNKLLKRNMEQQVVLWFYNVSGYRAAGSHRSCLMLCWDHNVNQSKVYVYLKGNLIQSVFRLSYVR